VSGRPSWRGERIVGLWCPRRALLEPKFDGFRVLVEVGRDGCVRAWSRHGTNLSGSVGDLLGALVDVPARTVFDGELYALTERDGRPSQNFAALCRAVLTRDSQAAQAFRVQGGDGRCLGRLGASNPDAGEHEPDGEQHEALAGGGKPDVSDHEGDPRRRSGFQASPDGHHAGRRAR
jgi:hypothetical protein